METQQAISHPEEQYLSLLREARDSGITIVDRGTNMILLSLFAKQMRFDLSAGFPLLTTKRVFWKGVLHELFWFLSGQTNIQYLAAHNVHIWDDYPYKIYKREVEQSQPKRKRVFSKESFIEKIRTDPRFAKKWGELPHIYGEMWRAWPTRTPGRTIDQLQWVLDELRDDPHAKNLLVTSWNPEYLYTMASFEDASLFPICHNLYQVSNRNGKLSLQLYQRSADLFLGVPFNIASYALLTIVLAAIAGLKPGEFIHTFGDVHIYANHRNQVDEQLSRLPRPLPRVTLDPSVRSLETFRPEGVKLHGYNPYPPIKAKLTVAGGLYDQKTGKMAGS